MLGQYVGNRSLTPRPRPCPRPLAQLSQQMFFGNATESEINGGLISSFPTSKVDYECSNGEAHVPKSSLSIPYYSRSNDDLFAECSSSKSCSSDRCVATGEGENI